MSSDGDVKLSAGEAQLQQALLAIEEQGGAQHGQDLQDARFHKLRRSLELLRDAGHAAQPAPDELESLGEFTLPPRYEVVSGLGQGGFGLVVLAVDKHLKRQVAIKVPKADVLLTKRMVARFLREAQHVAQLNHPNIIPVLGTDETATLPFIVYHYCHGSTLAQWLSRHTTYVPCRQAVQIVLLLAEAIHHAHQRGILHRDLKPSNILLEVADTADNRHGFTDQQTNKIPRITDFGISKVFDENSANASTLGVIVGTVQYMAPEQILGQSSDVGWHSDVYSLGVILYELLTHKRPFTGETAAQVLVQMSAEEPRLRKTRPDASRDLEAIVQRALSIRIEERYSSALELAEDLRCFLEGLNVKARPQSAWSRVQRWAIRQPLVATLSVLCFALLVAASIMAVSYFRQIRTSLLATAAANRELTSANSQASSARDQATQLASVLRQQLYLADMAAAADALRKNDILRYEPIISKYLPKVQSSADSTVLASRASMPEEVEVANVVALDQLRDVAWHVLWNQGHRQSKILVNSHKAIHHLALTNSQKMLAMCGDGDLVRLWDAQSFEEIRQWATDQGDLRSIAFSENDRFMATLAARGSVCIWDVATGEQLKRFETQARQAYQIVWQDMDTVITTGNDPVVHIWNWQTGERTGQLAQHTRGIEGLAISGDRQTLVSAGDDGQTCVWNLSDKSLAYILAPTPGRITDVVFCQTKPWIFTCDIVGKTRRLTLSTEPNSHNFVGELRRAAESVACSPDGRRIATGSREGVISLVDVTPDGINQKAIAKFGDAWQGHSGRVNDLAFSADGHSLLSVGQDGQCKLWETRSPTNCRLDLGEHLREQALDSFFIAEFNDSCLIGQRDKVYCWHPARDTFVCLGSLSANLHHMITQPESALLFSATDDGQVIGWKLAPTDTHQPLQRLWAKQFDRAVAEVRSLAQCTQLNWLAVASNVPDEEIQIFDTRTGAPIQSAWRDPELKGTVNHLAIAPTGKHLAAAYGKRIGLWDVVSGEVKILSGHADTISTLAFDPTGQLLASGAEDRCIRLWNASNGDLISELRHHENEIRSVLFSPDGRSLASTDRGAQTLLWRLDPPALSLELDNHQGEHILPNTWSGPYLYRMTNHRWLYADTFSAPNPTSLAR